MSHNQFPISCPLRGEIPFVACPEDEVLLLRQRLLENLPVTEAEIFVRGTLLPDGRLDLCKQNLGPVGCRRVVESLYHNAHVRSLLLGTDGIGDEGAAAVGEMLQVNTTLENVYLGCNGITAEGTRWLTESLTENRKVTGLWLKRNPIGDAGVEAIVSMLEQNKRLRVLDLVNTGIGIQGIRSLCRVLAGNPCRIERLYLGGNALDRQAAVELAQVLRTNTKLQGLYLNVGNLGNAGATEIAQGLLGNTTLRELGLASNGIERAGIESICAAICDHPALIGLDFGCSPSTRVLNAKRNVIDRIAVGFVVEMLERNPTLQRLDLSGTGIGQTQHALIEAALLASASMHHCVLDRGLSANVKRHLRQMANRCSPGKTSHHDLSLIRSVYRNV